METGLSTTLLRSPGSGAIRISNGAYLHQGTSSPAWTLATSTFVPLANMPTTGTSQVANELVDINGDGLDDWMQVRLGARSDFA